MDTTTYRCGEFHVDADNRLFNRGGIQIVVEPKAFAVILKLLARPGALVTRNELLDSVWGHRYVTPSTLNRLISLARKAFEDDSEVPRYIQTVHGAGYRYIGPIERGDPTRPEQRLRFVLPAIARLPARIDALIGREHELSALAALFLAHRALTVLGAGGIGKTQFALEAARRMAPGYPDGVWFFDLASMSSAVDWLRALASAFAIPPSGTREMLDKILSLLRGRRALLVIDNCDRVAKEVGALVIELLRGTDALNFLATSQVPLNFLGEQAMRMPPLALPPKADGNPHSLPKIAAAPAVQMLLTRIRLAEPDFELSDSNTAAIAEICIRLDGMPLALELAAPQFSLLSPEQVLDRLAHRFQFLNSDVAGRDTRHRNLLMLLDWSFDLLSSEEQRLLTWSSVFVQGWSIEGTIDLATGLGRDPETAIDLLTGLVNKSLVSAVPGLTPPRYRLLETVREYALDRLRLAQEEQEARNAHLAHVVRMSQAAHRAMMGGRMRECVEQLIHEHGNIAAAVDYALSTESGSASALTIVGSLMLYVKARGVYSEAPHWCRRALAGAHLPARTCRRAGAGQC